jgi:hypothetical protein
LEEALLRYETGVKLLRQCHELLGKAERRIELLAGVDADGNPVMRPFEIPENSGPDAVAGAGGAASSPSATRSKPTGDAGESRAKPPVRRNEERPAARPRRPAASGEIDESRELF